MFLKIAVCAKGTVTIAVTARIVEKNVVVMIVQKFGESDTIDFAITDAVQIQHRSIHWRFCLDQPAIKLDAVPDDDVDFLIRKLDIGRCNRLAQIAIKIGSAAAGL